MSLFLCLFPLFVCIYHLRNVFCHENLIMFFQHLHKTTKFTIHGVPKIWTDFYLNLPKISLIYWTPYRYDTNISTFGEIMNPPWKILYLLCSEGQLSVIGTHPGVWGHSAGMRAIVANLGSLEPAWRGRAWRGCRRPVRWTGGSGERLLGPAWGGQPSRSCQRQLAGRQRVTAGGGGGPLLGGGGGAGIPAPSPGSCSCCHHWPPGPPIHWGDSFIFFEPLKNVNNFYLIFSKHFDFWSYSIVTSNPKLLREITVHFFLCVPKITLILFRGQKNCTLSSKDF